MLDERLLELMAKIGRQEIIAALRAGLADVEAERTQPARTALNRLAKKHCIRDQSRCRARENRLDAKAKACENQRRSAHKEQ